jgi:hypothetical protein
MIYTESFGVRWTQNRIEVWQLIISWILAIMLVTMYFAASVKQIAVRIRVKVWWAPSKIFGIGVLFTK